MDEIRGRFGGTNPTISTCWYLNLISSVSRQASTGCGDAVAAAAQQLVRTYWQVGRAIMYLAAVDDLLARSDEKPTIGLLLCTSKNSVVAEYALRDHAAPIGVAEWATSITDSLPADLAAGLPSIETLEVELSRTAQEGL